MPRSDYPNFGRAEVNVACRQLGFEGGWGEKEYGYGASADNGAIMLVRAITVTGARMPSPSRILAFMKLLGLDRMD